ncbi:MAG: type I-A CRISPR-associated protein Cas7/Csa2 [Sulfolobales archaeon]
MVFLSLSARILLNVEALNMVESVGNFIRHRRAPVAVPTGGGFTLKYVPVISGESLAHSYQELIADMAVKSAIKVCDNCRAGYFIKHSGDEVLEDWAKNAIKEGEVAFEKAVIQNCVVEDVGGFLYAGRRPVKRTSRFQVGYMIPALDAITSTAVEAQFHVRYARSPEEQSIYNVEVGSAIYTFAFNLDVDGIGVLSSSKIEPAVGKEERLKRIEVAIKSLNTMLSNALFGARRSRFMPSWKVLNAVAVVSHQIPINAEPPHTKEYIISTLKKVKLSKEFLSKGNVKIDENVWMGYYKSAYEELPELKEVEEAEDLTKLISRALDQVVKLIT